MKLSKKKKGEASTKRSVNRKERQAPSRAKHQEARRGTTNWGKAASYSNHQGENHHPLDPHPHHAVDDEQRVVEISS